jgi:ATP diphosphatase
MRRLRDPESGCEWDKAQSFESIAPYTVEEAYEVADAIARNDLHALKDELAISSSRSSTTPRMAEEIGAFDLEDVMAAICAKMIRRHPHIFGDEATSPGWEALKAAERRQDEDQSALAGVALALPALKRAEKLQRRAARIGFDWPDSAGPRAKIDEELGELERAVHARTRRGAGRPAVQRRQLRPPSRHRPGNALRELRRAFEHASAGEEIATALKDMISSAGALWQRAKQML